MLQLFSEMGLCIDASSGYEIERAMRAGVKPEAISLSSQELPPNFDHYVKQGVTINACSLSQLDRFGQRFPGGKVRAAADSQQEANPRALAFRTHQFF